MRVSPSTSPNRRPRLARALAASIALAVLPYLSGSMAAAAEGCDVSWSKTIFDHTAGRSSDCGPAKPAAVDTKEDLRPDAIAWRSDEMLKLIDDAIASYTQIAQQGGWPAVPGTRMMRLGDDDERVIALRRHLQITHDLTSKSEGLFGASNAFDETLEEAVKVFQRRHGLRPSGRVDRPTLEALNVPVEIRIEQLKLNARRIRELLQGRIEERYILVNVPAYQLEAVEKFDVVQRHRVIVGKPDRQTPSVKASVKALNFFPHWHVPESVAKLDLIPRLVKEPQYLAEQHIRALASYTGPELNADQIDWHSADPEKIRFVQDPGLRNALGLVRIDMTNEYGVYMHDTPLKQLFAQQSRAFSAGCVRVSEVFDLVKWIASGEAGWQDPNRVMDTINAGQAVDLKLNRPVPVYFTYITAWAEPTGRVVFMPDIYNRDGVNAGRERDPSDPAPVQTGLAP